MSRNISIPGNYQGYSKPMADGYVRDSRYITLNDGCRIAYDTFLPTLNGQVLEGQLPTVVVATGYRRAWPYSRHDAAQHVARRYPHLDEGEIATFVNYASKIPDGRRSQWIEGAPVNDLKSLAEWVRIKGSSSEYLLVHGYALIVVDVRGTGASFGKSYADGWQTGKDLAEIFDFLVEQSWCNGNIGMIGCSWQGGTQYFTMNYGSPHLKAAIPQMASYDVYYAWYPGGAYLSGFLRQWSKRRESEDREQAALPVNEDPEGALLAQALDERKETEYPTDEKLEDGKSAPDMPRMSRDELLEMFPIKNRELANGTRIDLEYQALDFKRSSLNGTAVYFYTGWFDLFPRDVTVAYWNYKGPKKFIIGPWHHNNYWDREEARRWFDYWLCGIENGIMDEAPFTFSTQNSNSRAIGWSGTREWPLPFAETQCLYLLSDKTGTKYSVNNGVLGSKAPDTDGCVGELQVVYGASAGTRTRTWYHGGPQLDYSAMADNNRNGLTWTSEPLTNDIEISGHPELTLYLSSTTSSGIVVAYLEEIDENGDGEIVTEVVQNLEYRDIQPDPPIEFKDLAYRSYDSSTRRPITPGEIMEIRVDMLPVSCIVQSGRCLRLSIHGADCDNFYTVESNPPPTYRIFSKRKQLSRLRLPVINQDSQRNSLWIQEGFEGIPEKSRFAVKRGG
jgi:putative CocE/NonD family hydrolase